MTMANLILTITVATPITTIDIIVKKKNARLIYTRGRREEPNMNE